MIVERVSINGFLARLAGGSFYTNPRFAVIRKSYIKPQVQRGVRGCRSGTALARQRKCIPAEERTPWVFDMIESVIRLLFRCSHKRLTLPMTPMGKTGVPTGKPYVVCLDCGCQFAYDWKEMRVGERIGEGGSAVEGKSWLNRLLRRLDQPAEQERKP
jgi:hypothetical protein